MAKRQKEVLSFEQATENMQTILGLSAVKRTDLFKAIDLVELKGADLVNKNVRKLGEVAEYMVNTADGAKVMNEEEKVEPPLTETDIEYLDTLHTTYSRFVPETEAKKPKKASKPNKTSDAKS